MKTESKKVIAVIGLGYVGLPVAVAFAKKYRVIAFDIDKQRLAELKAGNDRTREVSGEELKTETITFTDNVTELTEANFFIITVPTPIDKFNQPDFTALIKASETVGIILKHGDIVVYESTVYPGAIEEVCLPILQMKSQLKVGEDFSIGYSPERINPGDTEHCFTKIKKVVAGYDKATLKEISQVYSSIVKAGVFEVSSIKVAEAAKVIENIQRDVNIALINELAMLFDRLGIDTLDVLDAAGTKWNFLPFRPGLVGGHCIGVDPYYLTYKAESVGYHPQVILSGRRINNSIPNFIIYRMLQELLNLKHNIATCVVTILGVSFKENCPDIRNSKVIDMIDELAKFNIRTQVCDPVIVAEDVEKEYGIKTVPLTHLKTAHVIIFAVAHDEFKQEYKNIITSQLQSNGIVIDVKGIVDREFIAANNITYWRL